MNSTSCGVLLDEPVPGVGMMPLMSDIAELKSVSVSLLQCADAKDASPERAETGACVAC